MLLLLELVVFLGGLYLALVLFFHAILLLAIPFTVVWLGLLLVIGLARRSLATSRRSAIVPKIRKE